MTTSRKHTHDTMPESFVSRLSSRLSFEPTTECSLCYESTPFVSVGTCGHAQVCWLCCLRLRWIIKDTNCAICKEQLTTVDILRVGAAAPQTPKSILKGVAFHDDVVLKEAIRLTSYICPYPCGDSPNGVFDFKSLGDLQTHLKRDHDLAVYCSICLDHRQYFLPEQIVYSSASLTLHTKEEHPACDFCGRDSKFYSIDELLAHMNQAHFKCIVCDRLDHRNEYYANFDALDRHFEESHFRCEYPECREQRFVVFADDEDLRLHWLEKHGRGRSIGLAGSTFGAKSTKKLRNRQTQATYNSVVHFRGPRVPSQAPFERQIGLDRYPDLPAGRHYDKRVHANIVRQSTVKGWMDRLGRSLEKAVVLTPQSEGYKAANIEFLKKLEAVLAPGDVKVLKTMSVDYTQRKISEQSYITNVRGLVKDDNAAVDVVTDLIRLMPDAGRRGDLLRFVHSSDSGGKIVPGSRAVVPKPVITGTSVDMPDTLFEAGSKKPCLIHALHAIVSADTATGAPVVASKDMPQSILSAMENKINSLDRIQLSTLSEMRTHFLTLSEGRVQGVSWTHADAVLSLRPLLYRLMQVPETHRSRERELIASGWRQFAESTRQVLEKFNKTELFWIKAYVALSVLRLSSMGHLESSKRVDFPSLPLSAYFPGSDPSPAPVVHAPTRADFPVGLPAMQAPVSLIPGARPSLWQNASVAMREEAFPELEPGVPLSRPEVNRPWNCPRCTFHNTRLLSAQCEICGFDKPPPGEATMSTPDESVAPSRQRRIKQRIVLSSSTQRDYTR